MLAPLLWLFRRALFGGEMFVYRDAAHYYFPLYHYVQSRWASGGLPLWNPLDGIGQPLLGDPTAAVLYPGKLIFLLPFEFSTCFVLYVVGHLWLAGCGTYVLARHWRVHWQGALLGGLAYELSGQVLFQYCNPIYCVGAAWLPCAVLFLDRTLITGDRRAAVCLGVVLSLMTLGGDPQTAYHLLLMGLLLILLLARRDRKHAAMARSDKNVPSTSAHGNPTRKRGPLSIGYSRCSASLTRRVTVTFFSERAIEHKKLHGQRHDHFSLRSTTSVSGRGPLRPGRISEITGLLRRSGKVVPERFGRPCA